MGDGLRKFGCDLILRYPALYTLTFSDANMIRVKIMDSIPWFIGIIIFLHTSKRSSLALGFIYVESLLMGVYWVQLLSIK